MKISIWIGSIVTIGYLLFWIIFEHSTFFEKWPSMDLNSKGDFLAGLFAPLAFLWLIISFFHQSRELQNSVQALNIQAEELKDANLRQNEMINLTKIQTEQANAIRRYESESEYRNHRPHFYVIKQHIWNISNEEILLHVINSRNDGYFNYSTLDGSNTIIDEVDIWRNGEIQKLRVPKETFANRSNATLRLKFSTSLGTTGYFMIPFAKEGEMVTSKFPTHTMST